MIDQVGEQVTLFDLDSSFGKMYQVHSAVTKEKTSKQLSQKSSKFQKKKFPICLYLTGGGWTKSGCIYDELGKWSIAWRVHDAQFWGVPQRRKRIALVADFGGLSAPEILFERKGLRWNPEPCEAERKRTAEGTERGFGETGELIIEPRTQDGCARLYGGGITPTLNTASGGQRQPCVMVFEQNQREEVRNLGDCSSAVKAESGMHNQTYVVLNDQGGAIMSITENKTATIRSQMGGHQPLVLCAPETAKE